MSRPFVTVVVPTYNRREFLPYLLHQYKYQTYPHNCMELLIIDDSPETNEDIFAKEDKKKYNIRYIYLKEKIRLGTKRNMLNDEAKGDIIVCMDDDDWYPSCRVSHCVQKLTQSKMQIGGSTILHIYYPHIDLIYQFGPYGVKDISQVQASRHSTAGPMCYTKEYTKTHRYPDDADKAEEKIWTNGFSEPMVQLDPHQTMICFCYQLSHTEKNTVSKLPFISQGKPITIKINNFFQKTDKLMLNRAKELRERMIKYMSENPVDIQSLANELNNGKPLQTTIPQTISSDMLKNMSPETLKNISKDIVKNISPDMLKNLHPDILKNLHPDILKNLPPNIINPNMLNPSIINPNMSFSTLK